MFTRTVSRVLMILFVLIVAWTLSGCSPVEEPEKDHKPLGESKEAHRPPGGGGETHTSSRTVSTSAREVALVPVAHLTSRTQNLTMEELSQTQGLAVPETLEKEAGKLLGDPNLTPFRSATEVLDHVSQTPEAIGLVSWEAVSPRVKALSVDGKSLFASSVASSNDYPLKTHNAHILDPNKLRRIVVGGDVILDRGVYYQVFERGRGLNFPFGGGYAAVTQRTSLTSPYSEHGIIHKFVAERRGGQGAVRRYLRGADLALVNLENPIVGSATYHPDGTIFTGDIQLLTILKGAGIDGVTLANNHTLDAGAEGLLETKRHLNASGIRSCGAGENLAAAREPEIFELGELEVGVLCYQGVPSYEWAWATETAPGMAPPQTYTMREDIERLRPKVDIVVVMPHWGLEYTATPEPGQVEFAHAAVDAGADLIIGDHAHWPKGIEIYRGKPIFYGTGNLVFDQPWSEETSTGIFAEATIYGDRVVQTRPVPFIILNFSQPNFLLPDAGGNRALDNVYAASLGPEFESYKASLE